ncbi:MAG TPA: putative porin, partial [Chitinophagales bacterium]|nr:putative porin [Chitinophagales bacterium]
MLAVVCISNALLGQAQTPNDSVYHRFDPKWTRYYFVDDLDKRDVIDTSTVLFHRYHPGFDEFNEAHTGNLGAPSFRLSPQLLRQTGYRVGLNAYDAYFYTPENLPLFATRRPYTSLEYVLGIKNEQMFSGTHTQNITPHYNFNVRFNRLGSDGTFSRQRADYFNLAVGQSFFMPDKRYYAQALVYQNRATLQQNGGITIPLDSAYDNQSYFDKLLVPVRFDSSLTRFRQRNAFVQHGVQFGKRYDLKTDTATRREFYATARLQHRFQYQHTVYRYRTDSVDFDAFENVFIDTVKTNDTTVYHVWKNELRFQITDVFRKTDSTTTYKPAFGFVALEHELYQFVQTHKNDLENKSNVIAKVDFQTNFENAFASSTNPLRFFGVAANGAYNILGDNEGDYTANGRAFYRVGPVIPGVVFHSARFAPTRFETHYNGNHYGWDTAFTPSTMTLVGGSLIILPLKGLLSYSFVSLKDPVYF